MPADELVELRGELHRVTALLEALREELKRDAPQWRDLRERAVRAETRAEERDRTIAEMRGEVRALESRVDSVERLRERLYAAAILLGGLGNIAAAQLQDLF